LFIFHLWRVLVRQIWTLSNVISSLSDRYDSLNIVHSIIIIIRSCFILLLSNSFVSQFIETHKLYTVWHYHCIDWFVSKVCDSFDSVLENKTCKLQHLIFFLQQQQHPKIKIIAYVLHIFETIMSMTNKNFNQDIFIYIYR
jgi:hypothetical protein